MVKFNFGLGGGDDSKKDDGQAPQTDDSTSQTTDPVVDESTPSGDIKIEETTEIQTDEKPNVNISETKETTGPVVDESTSSDDIKNEETTDNNNEDEVETKDPVITSTEETKTDAPAALDPFSKVDNSSSEEPFAVEEKTVEDPFATKDDEKSTEDSEAPISNPFSNSTDQDNITTAETEKTEENPVAETPVTEESPIETPEKNIFGAISEKTAVEETTPEDTFGGDLGNDTTSGTANDPIQTLSKLKDEIKNFVEAKKARITELNKEIADRKNEIKAEEKSLADKQKEFATMLDDIQNLTGEFDKKKKVTKK